MATKKSSTKESVDLTAEGIGSVDQIRDILFGPQIREMERKLARLEERLAKEVTDLRGDFKQRLEALETYSREEIDAVSRALEVEKKDRKAQLDDLNSQLKDLSKGTDLRFSKVDEQIRKEQKELRQSILDLKKNLNDDIQGKHDSVSQALDREVSELRDDKVDREGLAALLTELAFRIKGEPLLTGEE